MSRNHNGQCLVVTRGVTFAIDAGGGARTHTILRSLDFESSASASSATPAAGKSENTVSGKACKPSRKIDIFQL
jgi:hypothetical protein